MRQLLSFRLSLDMTGHENLDDDNNDDIEDDAAAAADDDAKA